MPYTLAKMLVWIVLAVGLGVITGWLLRNVTARRQILRARSQRSDGAEVDRLRERITTLESTIAQRDRRIADLESDTPEPSAAPDVPTPDPARTDALIGAPVDPEIAGAEAILECPVERDDLKLIVGIGPNVEDLCHGIGIRTWDDLAATEVSLLQTMLTDAGARFKTLDPSTWPSQAGLLARHDWQGFKALCDELAAPSDASTP
ncbi:MAG: hypothetical protein CL424_18235 [Acidimicrobiaceae bacterium]|nr:hypothetical protein [Acidimicrobiaceae bacterium]